MEKVILYNYFRSSTSYRVRIALNHKGIQYDYKPIHLLNNGGEQHSPEFRRINPQGEVPALVHRGKVIAQSMAIVEYLEEVFPNCPLLPVNDPWARSRVRQICENINSFLHPVNNLKILQYLEAKHGYDLAQKEVWFQHWAQQGLEALEKLIGETHGKFCMGDTLTLADTFLIPQLFSCKRFKVDLSSYSILNKINENCQPLESFKKSHPMMQPDTPKEA